MISLAILLLPLSAIPANAQSWPTTAGWNIEERAGSCRMAKTFQRHGATEIAITKTVEEKVIIVLSNDDWHHIEDKNYDLVFDLGVARYDMPASSGMKGIAGRGSVRPSYANLFNAQFFVDLGKADSLKVYLDDRLIDHFSLSGSAAASSVLENCLAMVNKRSANVSPIIGNAAALSSPVRSIDLMSMFGFEKYPGSALTERREGRAQIVARVEADGKATSCEITASSGHPDLDQATCEGVYRARFEPAIDTSGRAVAAPFTTAVTWTIERAAKPSQPQ